MLAKACTCFYAPPDAVMLLAESSSEPAVAEPSFVPFRGAAMRLDGKTPSSSTAAPSSLPSAGAVDLLDLCNLCYAALGTKIAAVQLMKTCSDLC